MQSISNRTQPWHPRHPRPKVWTVGKHVLNRSRGYIKQLISTYALHCNNMRVGHNTPTKSNGIRPPFERSLGWLFWVRILALRGRGGCAGAASGDQIRLTRLHLRYTFQTTQTSPFPTLFQGAPVSFPHKHHKTVHCVSRCVALRGEKFREAASHGAARLERELRWAGAPHKSSVIK